MVKFLLSKSKISYAAPSESAILPPINSLAILRSVIKEQRRPSWKYVSVSSCVKCNCFASSLTSQDSVPTNIKPHYFSEIYVNVE